MVSRISNKRKFSTRRNNKVSSQKVWNQKGCSKRMRKTKNTKKQKQTKKRHQYMMYGGNCGCGLPQVFGQSGGCGCGLSVQGGGGNGLTPGPLIGSTWTPNVGTWPGVAGLDGRTNYYKVNEYPTDPQTAMISGRDNGSFPTTFWGGKKGSKSSKRSKRNKRKHIHTGGGFGLIPQDILNAGRNVAFNVKSMINTVQGYPPLNGGDPIPYKGHYPKSA